MSASTRAGIVHLGPCERSKIAIFSKGESRWKLSYGGGMAPTIGLPTSPTPAPDLETPPNAVCSWFFAISDFGPPFSPPASRLCRRDARTEMASLSG